MNKVLSIFLLLCFKSLFSQTNLPQPTIPEKPVVFEKKPSIISIPIDISIEDLQGKINSGMPNLIYEDNSFEDNQNDELKAKVWRKGNLIFTSVVNDVLTYEVPLKVWAQKRISVLGVSQAPATEFELKLKFSSKFGITTDYSIQTITNGLGYEWITKPVLKYSYVEIPIGPVIGKLISNNLATFAKQIDQTIKDNYSLKPYVIEAWNTAQKPFLASEEYNTWVKLEPLDVYFTPLKAVGKSLKSTFGLKIFVETLVGTPIYTPKQILTIPNLKAVSSISDVFEVQLFNVISFEEATKISRNMFMGQVYDFKNGKYKIEVTDLEIKPDGEYLSLVTTTKGSFKGQIFLKGIPIYDPVKKLVVLTKTELDIKTKNVLHKAGGWLLEGTREKKIESEFGLPVTDIIEFGKQSVLQTINSEISKGIKMKGEIFSIVPDQVKVAENGILATVIAKAKVELVVKGM
ncbi:MAG: DUF4403 family protein [Leadbetterella sp.]|nr:DUF4403 family protein [Leadbetterella sp.]